MLNSIATLWSRYRFTHGEKPQPLKYFLPGHIASRRWNWALPVIFSDRKTTSYVFYPPLCTWHLVHSCRQPVTGICRRDGGTVICVPRTTGSLLSWVSVVPLAARMGPSRANVSKCWLLNKVSQISLPLLALAPGSGPQRALPHVPQGLHHCQLSSGTGQTWPATFCSLCAWRNPWRSWPSYALPLPARCI